MKLGTKSLLFGAHQFLLHPIFVYAAWAKLYGWTLDPVVITSFIVHDWGYWGKENMDGEDGKEHPRLGAKIMHWLFDDHNYLSVCPYHYDQPCHKSKDWYCRCFKWHDFSLYHSRSIAKQDEVKPSKLCAADKLASALMPWWIYVPLTTLTGEIKEYMQYGKSSKVGGNIDTLVHHALHSDSKRWWCWGMQQFMRNWANSNVEGAKV